METIIVTSASRTGRALQYTVDGTPRDVREELERCREEGVYFEVPDRARPDEEPCFVNAEHVVVIYGKPGS